MKKLNFFSVTILVLVLAFASNICTTNAQNGGWQSYTHPMLFTQAHLRDVDIISSNDVWAVGSGGTIAHYDGSKWSLVDSPTEKTLSAISMTSATDGWAVGSDGTIVHYDGNGWSLASSPTQEGLYDLAMVAPDDGWAVGGLNREEGVILHYDGTAWTLFSSPTTDPLQGIHMLSATDGWIVGRHGGISSPRTILHWDGTSWSLAGGTSTINHDLYAVHMSSPTSGWSVGTPIVTDSWILRYHDGSWTRWGTGRLAHKRKLYDISSVSEEDAWIVGESGWIYRFNGSEWSVFDRHPGGFSLRALDFMDGEGWAVGNSGTIMHFNGQVWTTVHEAWPTAGTVMGVDMLSQMNAWAVGYESHLWGRDPGGNFILHFDGSTWHGAGYASGVSYLYALDMVSATEGWAVGRDGGIAHFDGSTWTTVVASGTGSSLFAIHMIDQNSGWAVGGDGAIQRYTDSGGWEEMSSPTTISLYGLDCVSATSCWAVGEGRVGTRDQSVILRFDGGNWSLQKIIVGEELRDIDAVSDSDVWAVGLDGSIYHYDGQDWTFPGSPTSEHLYAVRMLSTNDGWAAGKNGVILYYNGSVWSTVDSPTSAYLYDIDLISTEGEPFGLAVGDDLIFTGLPTFVMENPNENPIDFYLSQNYPNPFNASTAINYQLPKSSRVKLTVYNILGQPVAILVDKNQNVGYHQVHWEARDISSGVYFYKIEVDGFKQARKMLVIK